MVLEKCSRAAWVFAFNSKGELYLAKKSGSPGYSIYYRDKLISAIADPDKISINIGQKYTEKGLTKDVDIDAGGGVTKSKTTTYTDSKTGAVIKVEKSADVTISGNSNTGLKDDHGAPLKDDPADILYHELVGHAIPHTGKPDTGNAVDNENKVRIQLKPGTNQKRAPEPSHVE